MNEEPIETVKLNHEIRYDRPLDARLEAIMLNHVGRPMVKSQHAALLEIAKAWTTIDDAGSLVTQAQYIMRVRIICPRCPGRTGPIGVVVDPVAKIDGGTRPVNVGALVQVRELDENRQRWVKHGRPLVKPDPSTQGVEARPSSSLNGVEDHLQVRTTPVAVLIGPQWAAPDRSMHVPLECEHHTVAPVSVKTLISQSAKARNTGMVQTIRAEVTTPR